MEEGVAEVREDELLLDDVCWLSGKDGTKKAVLGVCENKGKEANRAGSLVEKGRVEFEAMFYEGDGLLD